MSFSMRYPEVSVQLVGQDGNAFSILGRCKRAAQRGNVPPEEVDSFMKEATSGDYDHLLATCMAWFDCH
jgi:hypothetical protein